MDEQSPHRANILTPEWRTAGVGVFAARDGSVYATQLFGVPARLVLEAAELRAALPRWMLRVRARIGAGYALAAFAGSRLLAAAEADARGEVVLLVEAPSGPDGGRATFSRRRAGGSDPWTDLHAAELESEAGGRPVLLPAPPSRDSRFQLLERRLVEAPAAGPRLYLRGRTRVPAILVLADRAVRQIEPGAFDFEHPLDPRGTQHVTLGIPETPTCYRVLHEFEIDPATGTLRVAS